MAQTPKLWLGAAGYGLGMDFLMMESRQASSILFKTMNDHPAKAVKHGGPNEHIYEPLLIIWQHIKYCIGCKTPPQMEALFRINDCIKIASS